MQIVTDVSQKEIKQHGCFAFPLLISEERLSRYDTGSFLWHWHPEVEVTVVRSGSMRYLVNDQSYILKAGDALFGNANTLHSGMGLDGGDCAYFSITFDPRLLYGYEESAMAQRYVQPILMDLGLPAIHLTGETAWQKEAIGLAQEMCGRAARADEMKEFDLTVLLLRFWRLIYQNREHIAGVAKGDRVNFERIRKILLYIQEHYAQKLTLDEIAAHVHLCRGECSRLFSKYMHLPLFEYIMRYRIERSLPDLMDGQFSVSETARRAGFDDSNYYAKVFSKLRGISPTSFKKAQAKERL